MYIRNIKIRININLTLLTMKFYNFIIKQKVFTQKQHLQSIKVNLLINLVLLLVLLNLMCYFLPYSYVRAHPDHFNLVDSAQRPLSYLYIFINNQYQIAFSYISFRSLSFLTHLQRWQILAYPSSPKDVCEILNLFPPSSSVNICLFEDTARKT